MRGKSYDRLWKGHQQGRQIESIKVGGKLTGAGKAKRIETERIKESIEAELIGAGKERRRETERIK